MQRSTELHSLRKGPHYHWRKRTSIKPSPPFRKKTYQKRVFACEPLIHDHQLPLHVITKLIHQWMKWVKSSHKRLAEWLHYADSCPSSPHKVMWFENQGRTRSEGNWDWEVHVPCSTSIFPEGERESKHRKRASTKANPIFTRESPSGCDTLINHHQLPLRVITTSFRQWTGWNPYIWNFNSDFITKAI